MLASKARTAKRIYLKLEECAWVLNAFCMYKENTNAIEIVY